MLRSSLRGYSDEHILVKGTITVTNTAVQGQLNNGVNKEVIFKNRAPFTNCKSRINITQVDDVLSIDVVMPMYNLIEYSDNYSKTFGILWPYCKDEPALNPVDYNTMVDFNANNVTTSSFKIKQKIIGKTGGNGIKDVEIIVLLKYLSNFWRTLEMLLINCEINLDLNRSKNVL